MSPETEQKNTYRLYSLTAINIATFFGGPLAAGILVRRNFINLGDEAAGKKALFIGIFSTLIIFTVIFSLPEEILDMIPNALIPMIYTFIIYLIVDKYMGKAIKEHKSNSHPFYSGWKAAGIGLISCIIIMAFIILYALLCV